MEFSQLIRFVILAVLALTAFAEYEDSFGPSVDVDYFGNYVKKAGPSGPLRFGKRRGPSGPLRFGKRSGQPAFDSHDWAYNN
ncbi:unnamed protein product [Caenorhabditis angaria]|uniref:Uncharacterized protein n=1 Tax=Caenorhabditis angaria TaxID=860376 RepID=A0A9P1IK56_9PELO|nr:unnamed protein product [Caenorhabditis angaria]